MRISAVAQVRRFNRLVTQTVGALQDRYLGTDRPLAAARLLFEIGRGGAEVKALRGCLGLDSGYLSRLLRALEREGLVTSHVAGRDRRIRRAELTAAGLAAARDLDRRSDYFARSLLEPLGDRQRTRLVQAMAEVEKLLSAAAIVVSVESPASPEAQHCLREYFQELKRRFAGGFDPGRSLSPTAAEFVPPEGAFLVLRLRGQPVGCGAFRRMPNRSAYLKRMWIAPEARGLGLGRRLLQELENRARSDGCRTALLETNRALGEARQLYTQAGYAEVPPFNAEPYAHHWFSKSLRRPKSPHLRAVRLSEIGPPRPALRSR